MITFKHSSKRKLRRERDENLSIIMGGRSAIKLGSVSQSAFKKLKTVRNYQEKLRKDFVNARAAAYSNTGERSAFLDRPGILKSSSKNPNLNQENGPLSSIIFPVPSPPRRQHPDFLDGQRSYNGPCTINSLPPLVNTLTQARRAKAAALQSQQRGILKPVSSNQIPGYLNASDSQNHYWTLHANGGMVQKPKLATTVCSMSSRGSSKKTSTWKICSSIPMTRYGASLVQMEMASTMSGGSTSSSSNNFPFCLNNQNQMNHQGINTLTQPKNVVPALLKTVVPPPSPLLPNTPNSMMFGTPSNYSSCGVYQSEWMDRGKVKILGKAPTKQYSMEQIIDILCGFATPDSIMADQLFQPLPSAPSGMNFMGSSSAAGNSLFIEQQPVSVTGNNFLKPQSLSATGMNFLEPTSSSAAGINFMESTSAFTSGINFMEPSSLSAGINFTTPTTSSTADFNFTVPPPPASSTKKSNPLNDIFQRTEEENQNQRENVPTCEKDDGETSIYFRKAPTKDTKKKSVSFLTDHMDNICVTRHFFDPFSQEHRWSNGSSDESSSMNKENVNPNIFENFLPPSNSTNPFVNSDSSPFFNSNSLPEQNRTFFETTNMGVAGTERYSDNNCSNPVDSIFGDRRSSPKSIFDFGTNAATNSINGSEPLFPTSSSPSVPLFELGGNNTIGLVDSAGNNFGNTTFTATPFDDRESVLSGCNQQQVSDKSNVNSQNSFFSNISFDLPSASISSSDFSPGAFENIHPSWNVILNSFCSEETNDSGNDFFTGRESGQSTRHADSIPIGGSYETRTHRPHIIP